MSSRYVTAGFEAAIAPEHPREEVLEAVQSMLSYLGLELQESDNWQMDSCIWFDGDELGVRISGSQGGMCEEIFESMAMDVEGLCRAAFVTEFATDEGPSAEGIKTVAFYGPDEASKEALKVRYALDAADDLMRQHAGRPNLVGGIDAADVDGLTFNWIGATEQTPLVAVNLLGLEGADRRLAESLAGQLSRLLVLAAARKDGQLLVQGDALMPDEAILSDYQLAQLRLGPGQWEVSEGPTTGVGSEFWFADQADGRTAYVRVESAGVTALELHEPETTHAAERSRA